MLKQCSCVDRNFMTVFTWSLFCWSPVFTDATVPGNCGPKATISHRSHSASAHSGWLRWLHLRLYFQETYGIPLKKYHEHLTSLPTNQFKHNALYKSQTSDIEHTENTWWRETWPTTPQYRNIKQVHLAHVKQMAFYPFTVHGYERHRALTSLRKKEGNVTDKNVQYHILSLFFLL